MEITGKIIAVLEPRSGQSKTTGNMWMTQDYVIETIEQYPKRVCFNVWGEDKIKMFNIQVGQELIVSFDINAREWQGKWFNDVRAWKVEPYVAGAAPAASDFAAAPVSSAPFAAAPQAPAAPSVQQPQGFGTGGDSTDDLPF